MSGSSSSSLAAILGAVVGTIAFLGLIALFAYRQREKRRRREERLNGFDDDAGTGSRQMEEAPRTAFRHESFMALVRDAAQGFYSPVLEPVSATTSSGSGQSTGAAIAVPAAAAASTSHAAAHSGAPPVVDTAAPSGIARQASAISHGTRESSVGTLQYLDIGSPVPPPTQLRKDHDG
ncbi:hypothetical protein BGZ50_003444 [Haplosporangium sp. Z 11]|nr:hypothetical protein BGZ50_003444 [Haplosporangium sp. Z 11]